MTPVEWSLAVNAIDEQKADWQTMVSRFLLLAEEPQASALELEPCWTAGMVPIAAANRIIEGRRQQACDDVA